MWGAVTANIAQQLANPNFKDLKCLVKENLIFSYFFIEREAVLYPHYSEEDGLKFGPLSKTAFESKFLTSYVSTAIEKTTGSAKKGDLHEIELISHRVEQDPVCFVGYIFAREGDMGAYSVEIGDEKEVLIRNENDTQKLPLFDAISEMQVGVHGNIFEKNI